MPENQDKETRRELIIDEFLLKTIISLQVALSNISKDLDQKTDLMHDMTDSLTAVTYNMKEVRDKIDKKDQFLKEAYESIEHVNQKLELIEIKFDNDMVSTQGHIKEIKYAIQQLSNCLLELKIEKKATEEIEKKSSSKLDISEIFVKTWESVKNVRAILIIILATVLAIGALVGGQGFFMDILKALKSLLG